MPNYLSGRSKRTPQVGLREERYRYLSAADAEPNFGDPTTPGDLPPIGQQYQIVSVEGYPGERYWVPIGGGLIPGSISVFDEGNLKGGLSSTTQLNFTGLAITAYGSNTGLSNPGIAVTIQVFAPGNDQEILFNTANDFSTSSKLSFDNSTGLLRAGERIQVGIGGTVISTSGVGSVGIGTTTPTQKLHVQGDVRITGTIYDYFNNPGSPSFLITKNNFGGLSWVDPSVIRAGAGGTYQNIQYHNSVGLVDGAPIFVYDNINQRVGIGSTLPTVTLDVLGASRFVGASQMSQLNVSDTTTTQTLVVSGLTSTRNLIVTGVSTLGVITGTNAYFTGIVTANKFVGDITLVDLNVPGIATIGTLNVTGLTTSKNLRVFENTNLNKLNVSGISTFESQVNINNLNVTGVGTFDNLKLDANTVSTLSGNLIIDSEGGITQINDSLYINDTAESNNKDSGSLITEGGVGIEKNLYVGGNTNLATNGGITTTGGDLYVAGNLFVNNAITYDEIYSRRAIISEYLETKDFKSTGISTLNVVSIGGSSVFNNYVNFNNNVTIGSTNTNIVIIKSIISSDIIPSNDNTYNIGSASKKWNTIYASNFNGAFIGNAETASKLNTPRYIDLDGDVLGVGAGVTFDGSENIVIPTELSATGITSGTYGSSLKIPTFSVDSKGRLTSASDIDIDFGSATVSSISISSDSTNANRYIPFVDNINGISTLRTNQNFVFNPGLGRVGIGTSVPTSTLDVYGTLGLTPVGTINAIVKANGTSTGLALIGGTDDIIGEGGANIELYGRDHPTQPNNAFHDATFHRFRNKESNVTYLHVSDNVGVGINSPTDKLDVNGNIRLRSGLKDNNNSVGSANSILASTGSGVVWVSAQSVTGLGTTSTPQFSGIGLGTTAQSGFKMALAGGGITLRQSIAAVSGTYTIDITSGNEFVTNSPIAGVTTVNLSNLASLPTNYIWEGVLTFSYTSGTISWFSANVGVGYTVKWDGNSAITPTSGEVETLVIRVVGGASSTIDVYAGKGRVA